MTVRLEGGDCREVIKTLADDSVDACVTDPPYSLTQNKKGGSGIASVNLQSPYGRARIGTGVGGFMGQQWDTGEVAHDPAWWAEVYRVLKPGAHLVAFAGTRTYHRMVCAIEDAGFEIRDQIGWAFATGFPKSHNVAKAIDKAARGVPHGGADPTSPHHGEYRTQATEGKRSETDAGHGFGAGPGKFMAKGKPVRRLRPGADQNKDGSWEKLEDRIYQPHDYTPSSPDAAEWDGWGTALKPAWEPIVLARKPLSEGNVAANVLRWGTGALNIDGCRIGVEDEEYARNASGDRGHDENRARQSGFALTAGSASAIGRWPANLTHDGSGEAVSAFPDSAGQLRRTGPEFGDKYSRGIYGDFGPIAEHEPRGDTGSAARFFFSAKAGADDRWGSKHPTVKPVELIRWLMRLVTPPGGTVIDPFAGSGTAGVAALAEGFDAILIEREAQYIADIEARLAHYRGDGGHSLAVKARHKKGAGTTPLFDLAESAE